METRYVVKFDKGSGFKKWASRSQPTPEAAWAAAGIDPMEQDRGDAQLLEVFVRQDVPCNCGSENNWAECPTGSPYCG